jgi:hypothetical protein
MDKMVGATVVTGLYDIGREQRGDGRRWFDYLQWFAGTLKLNVPMVIFVDPSLKDFVNKHRRGVPTVVVCQTFDQIPAAKHLDAISAVLKGEFRQSVVAKTDLSYKLPEYLVVIFSKFGWLKHAMHLNPFKSDVFLWVDAGISRFGATDYTHWPHPSWMQRFRFNRRSVWIQAKPQLRKWLTEPPDDRIIGTCLGHLWASVFGGHITAVNRFCNLVHDYLISDMLNKNRIDNEQVAMSLVWSKSRDLVHFIIPEHIWNLWGWRDFHQPELITIFAKDTYKLQGHIIHTPSCHKIQK